MFLGVSDAPTARGRGPSTSNFLGLHSIDAYALCRRTTKFHIVINMGRRLIFSCYILLGKILRLPAKRAKRGRAPT